MIQPLERLYRRLLMIVGRGRVTLVDDSGTVQRIQGSLTSDEVRDRLARLTHFGFASNPPPGTDFVALFVGGDRSNGVSVADGHQPSRPTGLQPGESMLYDDLGQYVKLTRSGIVIHSPLVIRLEGPDIAIHATNSFKFDVNGHGQHWHPTTVDTWQDDEAPGSHHNIAPPEIP